MSFYSLKIIGPVVQLAIVILIAGFFQQTCDAFYDKEAYKAIIINDRTNDDAVDLNAQQLIARSGFKSETFYSIARDGYVTELIHVINPKADPKKLRKPPVLLLHGASIDPSAYFISSSIQHHPEKYPRTEADGPMTSANRSLGFVLVNNGMDVWVAGTRGSSRNNQGFVRPGMVAAARRNYNNFTLTEENFEFVDRQRLKYYSYGQDDIIAYELGEQFDRVLSLTGSEQFNLFSYSISTITSIAFLAQNPDYAQRVNLYIQLAPTINADHFTLAARLFWEKISVNGPTTGVGFVGGLPDGQRALGAAVLALSKTSLTRYSAANKILKKFFGPSLKYTSNLELNVLSHIFMPVSTKTVKQYGQQSVAKKLVKFDYGKVENLARYGQTSPPVYNISRIEVQNWLIVEGPMDALADPTTVQRLVETTSALKQVIRIVAPGYNHLDFLAGVENARYVILPILEQLIKYSL